MTLEIDEDGAVGASFALRPVIHPQCLYRPDRGHRGGAHDPQEGARTDGHRRRGRVTGTAFPTEGKAIALKCRLQASGAPCRGGGQSRDALGEDLACALASTTAEAPGMEMNHDWIAAAGQVGEGASVAAMDTVGAATAARTAGGTTRRGGRDIDRAIRTPETIDAHAGDARKEQLREHRNSGLSPVEHRREHQPTACRTTSEVPENPSPPQPRIDRVRGADRRAAAAAVLAAFQPMREHAGRPRAMVAGAVAAPSSGA
jgi:hypothetical protein